MTTPPERPIEGWYPDPEDPRSLRWWDGYRWTLRKPMPVAPGAPAPLGKGFHRLGWVARLGIRLLVFVSVAQLVLFVWGYGMIEEAIAGGDVDRLDLYDDLDVALNAALVALLLPTGICWMVWQYQLARSARREELSRSPGWHAWGYVVPIVAFWFPYGNMADLVRRRFPGRSRAVIRWWWAFYLVSVILDRIAWRLSVEVDSPEDFRAMLSYAVVSAAALIAAAPFALRLNRDLSDAERDGAAISPAGSTAG